LGDGSDPDFEAKLVGTIYGVLLLGFFPTGVLYRALLHNAVVNGVALDGVQSAAFGHRALAAGLDPAVERSRGRAQPGADAALDAYPRRPLLRGAHACGSGGSVDDFVSGQQPPAGAVGDAFTDIEGFDVGLPL
jgi:hypothetical protein